MKFPDSNLNTSSELIKCAWWPLKSSWKRSSTSKSSDLWRLPTKFLSSEDSMKFTKKSAASKFKHFNITTTQRIFKTILTSFWYLVRFHSSSLMLRIRFKAYRCSQWVYLRLIYDSVIHSKLRFRIKANFCKMMMLFVRHLHQVLTLNAWIRILTWDVVKTISLKKRCHPKIKKQQTNFIKRP
mgnify:CR=1 FL=1